MYFSINLATRTYLDRRLVNRTATGVFAVLIIALVWNIYRAAWNFGELRRLRADITSFESRLSSRPSGVSEKQYTSLLGDISFYNEIIGRKAYNWIGLLEQMELVTPEGIAISSFVPDRKTGELKIEGRAKNFALIKLYLDKLEDSKFFTSILLLSHSEIAAGERSRGIQFSISCKAAMQ